MKSPLGRLVGVQQWQGKSSKTVHGLGNEEDVARNSSLIGNVCVPPSSMKVAREGLFQSNQGGRAVFQGRWPRKFLFQVFPENLYALSYILTTTCILCTVYCGPYIQSSVSIGEAVVVDDFSSEVGRASRRRQSIGQRRENKSQRKEDVELLGGIAASWWHHRVEEIVVRRSTSDRGHYARTCRFLTTFMWIEGVVDYGRANVTAIDIG